MDFDDIQRLKRERNAAILAHYSQDSKVQGLAEFCGREPFTPTTDGGSVPGAIFDLPIRQRVRPTVQKTI